MTNKGLTFVQRLVLCDFTVTVEVCADRPPLPPSFGNIFEAPTSGISAGTSVLTNPAETNNCASANSTITRTVTVVPTITATLEGRKAGSGSAYSQNYVIVDYEDAANLKWTTTGNPTRCDAVSGTDWTGQKSPAAPSGEEDTAPPTQRRRKSDFPGSLTSTSIHPAVRG